MMYTKLLYFKLIGVSKTKIRVIKKIYAYTSMDMNKAIAEEMLTNLNDNGDSTPSEYKRQFTSYFMYILHGTVINNLDFYLFKSEKDFSQEELTHLLRTLPEEELNKGKIVLKNFEEKEELEEAKDYNPTPFLYISPTPIPTPTSIPTKSLIQRQEDPPQKRRRRKYKRLTSREALDLIRDRIDMEEDIKLENQLLGY